MVRWLRRRRRGAARELATTLIFQFPHFLRLLYGLLKDRRVSRVDRALVLGALVYVVTPTDLIPDFLGFLGRIDDLYLLGIVLDRLVRRAGTGVLHEHWGGTPQALQLLLNGLDQIGSLIPRPVRGALLGRVREA